MFGDVVDRPYDLNVSNDDVDVYLESKAFEISVQDL